MASTDFFTLGTEARYIHASPEAPKTVVNRGASNVGRKATADVTASDNALSTGQSVTIEAGNFFVSAASSGILVKSEDAALSGGSFRSPDIYTHSGSPISGTTYGNPTGKVDNGGLLLDNTSGNLYVNENTAASPYWTPVSFDQPGIFGAIVDKNVGTGHALASTAAYGGVGNGVRVFGQGLEQAGDAGFIGGPTGTEGSEVNVLHVTNEVSHLTALGMQELTMQADQHATMVVECTWADVADIATSSVFLGFIGAAADALDPVVTGATTVATFAIDDLCGWYSDSSMTDADGGFMISEKANAGGTQTGLVTTVNRAAFGTYQQLRIEVASDGRAILFNNKAEAGIIPGVTGANTHSATEVAVDPTEELSPVFYIENSTTTTRTANVKSFKTWATR